MEAILTAKEMSEKDEFGLYVHASNYADARAQCIAAEINHSKMKLERIPKWIRIIFDAL
jgi:hypothetical protein